MQTSTNDSGGIYESVTNINTPPATINPMNSSSKVEAESPALTAERRNAIIALAMLAITIAWAMPGGGVAKEGDEKPLSAEEVLKKKILGKATVEVLVDEVTELNIASVIIPGESHIQLITARLPKGKGTEEFVVIVSKELATRLLRSGIVDPTDYFRRKKMRVSGIVARIDRTPPEVTTYKIHVTRMEQLESVRTP
jgi:hypothetical protein